MRLKFYFSFFLFLWLFTSQQIVVAQEFVTADTSKTEIQILPGVKKLEYRKIDSLTEVQILVGNVQLKQGTTLFYCDSSVINNRLHLFEAWGNVHINDSDSTHIYSDKLRYITDKKLAYLTKNVKLTDGKGILTTQNLEYDLNTKIGIYRNGGKVVNKKTVLTSQEGFYYSEKREIYFKKKVQLKDPTYTLESDSLVYNTTTEISRFIAPTIIKDSSNRTIQTQSGFYSPKTGKAEFEQRPIFQDGSIIATGDRMISDDSSGITQFYGRAIIIDTLNDRTVIANKILINNKAETFLATQKPLMIIKQENDSLYIAADTLFSAKFSETKNAKAPAKIKNVEAKKSDSSNRYFEAYRNVRIFSDSLQGVCDSLFYSYLDSTFRLYYNPVIWANQNQLTGDTILLFTKNKKAERMEIFKNSLVVNRVQKEIYNQIKSTRLNAFFVDGRLDSARARGYAECIYFIQDEDSAFTGINQSNADMIDIYFQDQELNRVVFRSEVKGTIWPIQQKDPKEMRLSNFKWLEDKRPKTKYKLFE